MTTLVPHGRLDSPSRPSELADDTPTDGPDHRHAARSRSIYARQGSFGFCDFAPNDVLPGPPELAGETPESLRGLDRLPSPQKLDKLALSVPELEESSVAGDPCASLSTFLSPSQSSQRPGTLGRPKPPPVVTRPLTGDRPLIATRPRVGDRVFRRLTFAAGIAILATLALVTGFLLVQGAPALLAPAEVLAAQGYGPFGSWVAPYAFGTLWVAVLALGLSVPVALGVALFMSHYAPRRLARPLAYVIDLLAAVPSVVYGLWGTFVLAPAVQPVFEWLAANAGWIPLFAGPASGTGRTILTAALVLAVMVLPITTSLAREVFLTVPAAHEEAALALGATRWELVRIAVLPYARPGVVAAVMLGLGRALGETMAVAMVLSGGRSITFALLTSDNPNTIAATIAQNFPEAFGLRTNELIAAGLVLFAVTLAVNLAARWIARRAPRGAAA